MHKVNVQTEWQNTAEGFTVLEHFYNPKTSGRKFFGILEQPAIYSSVEEVRYKVVLLGKSGVGKTWTVAKLAGNDFGSYQTSGTVGIRVTDIYWPVKVWDKIILFKLTLWDPGSHSFKKYTHIPLSSYDKADMHLLVFSYNDANSFAELALMINKSMKKEEESLPPGIFIIGTKFLPKTEVSMSDVQDLQLKHNIHVMSLPALSTGTGDITRISPVLNAICEQLWFRDQQYIMNQSTSAS